MAAVNIGTDGAISVDGQRFEMKNKECLYIPMGSKDVTFEGDGARFYLASLPAHKICPIKHVTLDQANPLARGDLANSNQRTIYQLVIPGVCESAQLLLGLTVLEEGSVWNTRSEEHTSELQSLMRISYAVFCLKKKKKSKI